MLSVNESGCIPHKKGAIGKVLSILQDFDHLLWKPQVIYIISFKTYIEYFQLKPVQKDQSTKNL